MSPGLEKNSSRSSAHCETGLACLHLKQTGGEKFNVRKPIPPSQIPASHIEYERRELDRFCGTLLYENELVLKLKGILREIDDQENAASEILKATSPDNPQDAYDRRRATVN